MYQKLDVHVNFVKELRRLKRFYPQYRSMSLPQITAYIKPLPLLAKKETAEKHVQNFLKNLHAQIRVD